MKSPAIVSLYLGLFLAALLFASSCPALTGDGGSIAACYPGGFHQVLLGVKPFAAPCMEFTPVGMCYHKGQPWAAMVKYWVPLYAIEVTGQAGTTIFPYFAPFQSLLERSAYPGSMVQGEAGNDTQTKFREAHIYVFSKADIAEILAGYPALACILSSGSFIGETVFRSEDSAVWKTCRDAVGSARQIAHVGDWGPLFPRCGWSNHPSNVTASLLYAYRAQDLASGINGVFSVDSGRILLDRYEIGGPTPGACYPIGTPAMAQEKNANRMGCADRIIIVYWQMKVTCCAGL